MTGEWRRPTLGKAKLVPSDFLSRVFPCVRSQPCLRPIPFPSDSTLMKPISPPSLLAFFALGTGLIAAEPPPFPHPLLPGMTVQLVAQEPDVCTPTAIAADPKGRVWVLQNNTHMRPEKYDGPPTDRVVILDDFGPDGRARKITPYADGFRDGMGLLLLPDGDLIVSTRAETMRFHDRTGSGRGEERRTLLKMESEETYPHNGLSSLALGPDGLLYLGCGENMGKPWKLTGRDGTSLNGTDEGAVFRIDAEGRHLEWLARGLWNPFGQTFDPAGRLFAFDNDPGAGEFCRMVQIVRGGEYGYRRRYGSNLDYPFISWQGRAPGTLPPLSLVPEGPTGLLWVGDSFLGCSWSDFGIVRLRLERRGASFTTRPEWIVQGDYRFRPSGIARTPDGSLVVSDWVDSSYPVHGQGRVWRLRGYDPKSAPLARSAEEETLEALLTGKTSREEAVALLDSADPYLRHGAVQRLVPVVDELLADPALEADAGKRLGVLLVAKRSQSPHRLDRLPAWLHDADPAIRREALQWSAEERVPEALAKVDLTLEGEVTKAVFDTYVAVLDDFSAGKPLAQKDRDAQRNERLLAIAVDEKRSSVLRARALHDLPTDYAGLSVERLKAAVATGNGRLRTEAIRVLATRGDAAAQAELRAIAESSDINAQDRADAIVGLGLTMPPPQESLSLLRLMLKSPDPAVAREALRTLGAQATPQDLAGLPGEPSFAGAPFEKILSTQGDAVAGRRLFFHPTGPGCFNCHQVERRGRAIGPDLSHLNFTPEQILTALREPSKDVAPAFLHWHVKKKDGTEGYGVDIFRNDTAKFYLIDITGKITAYRHDEIAQREAMPLSLMPPGLLDRFSIREVADLLAFLQQSRE